MGGWLLCGLIATEMEVACVLPHPRARLAYRQMEGAIVSLITIITNTRGA